MSRVIGACLAAAVCGVAGSVMAEDVPLPADVKRLGEARDVAFGSQALKVQAFATSLPLQEVRAFYQQTLPKKGWRLSPVPWFAGFEASRAELKEVLRVHQAEVERDPALKAQVEALKFDEISAELDVMLHAERGSHHLLLNLYPEKDQTLVFVNRWEGEAFRGLPPTEFVADAQLNVPGAAGATGWMLGANSCCTGEAVPETLRRLPPSVPMYPQARIISSSAPSREAGGMASAVEVSLSPDPVETIAAFYRTEMAARGWLPMEGSMGGQEPSPLFDAYTAPGVGPMKMALLAFQNEQGLCGVSIVENAGGPALLGLVQEMGESAEPISETTERTGIVVTYLELTHLKEFLTQPDLPPVKGLSAELGTGRGSGGEGR